MRLDARISVIGILGIAVFVLMNGCDRKGESPTAKPEATTPPIQQPQPPKPPLIKKADIIDWCPEHGVPESICTRCNSKLIDGFKKKYDWCSKHELPESQCLVCHPDLKAKFEAMAPKKDKP